MQSHIKILSTKVLSQESVSMLENKGASVFQHNFIKTESILTDADAGLVNSLAQQRLHVIFTSANAVHAVAEKLQFQPKWKVFCINGKTRKTIEKLFTKVEILDSSPTGELLAEKILAHSDVRHIVFFSGSRRLDTIPDALLHAGFNLQEIVVYKTSLTPVRLDENFSGILFFSPSGVESYFSVNRISKETALFSIGPSTTKALKNYSGNISECSFPSEEELAGAAYRYFFQQEE